MMVKANGVTAARCLEAFEETGEAVATVVIVGVDGTQAVWVDAALNPGRAAWLMEHLNDSTAMAIDMCGLGGIGKA
jgi:hypothetical protein